MEKLISTREFVLHLRGMTTSELCKIYPRNFKRPVWNGDKDEVVKDFLAIDAIQWRLTGEYAKFLSKPLTLGMFVPVDEDGNVIEKPNHNDDYYRDANGNNEDYFEASKQYAKAKSRVLFEGFKVNYFVDNGKSFEVIGEDGKIQICVYKSQPDYFIWNNNRANGNSDHPTIESYLVQFKPTLTETAKKQILG